jgi:hypothetical protein
LLRSLGRSVKKIWKKIKGGAAKVSKKIKARRKARKNMDAPALAGEQRSNAGSKVFKLLALSAIASGMIASGVAETPVGVPVTALLGGEIARTTQQIWSTQ